MIKLLALEGWADRNAEVAWGKRRAAEVVKAL